MSEAYDSGTIVTSSPAAPTAGPPTKPLPARPLGRTGHQATIFGLGGLFTVARHDRHDEAVEIVNRALDLGVNYIDTCALYGNGASELNIGTVMRERRDEVFLASKSHNYTYDGTMALVEQSLRRLQTEFKKVEDSDASINGKIDEAYLTKYSRYPQCVRQLPNLCRAQQPRNNFRRL